VRIFALCAFVTAKLKPTPRHHAPRNIRSLDVDQLKEEKSHFLYVAQRRVLTVSRRSLPQHAQRLRYGSPLSSETRDRAGNDAIDPTETVDAPNSIGFVVIAPRNDLSDKAEVGGQRLEEQILARSRQCYRFASAVRIVADFFHPTFGQYRFQIPRQSRPVQVQQAGNFRPRDGFRLTDHRKQDELCRTESERSERFVKNVRHRPRQKADVHQDAIAQPGDQAIGEIGLSADLSHQCVSWILS
jgi:hypothetical protein